MVFDRFWLHQNVRYALREVPRVSRFVREYPERPNEQKAEFPKGRIPKRPNDQKAECSKGQIPKRPNGCGSGQVDLIARAPVYLDGPTPIRPLYILSYVLIKKPSINNVT